MIVKLWWYSLKSSIALEDSVRQSFRAWPWICDNNLHINNANYLRLMESGRMQWIARSGMLKQMLNKKVNMILAGMNITYRREVKLGTVTDMVTRLAGWDERWLYYEQTLYLPHADGPKIAMRALLRCQLVKGRELVRPEEAWTLFGWQVDERPELPDDFQAWLNAADAAASEIKSIDQANA
jgi:acyl-CoA thioesterase FadM